MTEGDIISLSSKLTSEAHLGRVVIMDEAGLVMINNSDSYFDLHDWDVEVLHHED